MREQVIREESGGQNEGEKLGNNRLPPGRGSVGTSLIDFFYTNYGSSTQLTIKLLLLLLYFSLSIKTLHNFLFLICGLVNSDNNCTVFNFFLTQLGCPPFLRLF